MTRYERSGLGAFGLALILLDILLRIHHCPKAAVFAGAPGVAIFLLLAFTSKGEDDA